MLLKKLGVKNYFIVLIILLGITTLLVFSTFFLAAVFPDSLGRSPYNYGVNTTYEFEPWSFEVDSLKVNFPQGGIIVNIHESDHKRSMMLLGEGIYEQNGLALTTLNTGGLFIVLEHNLFEEIRGNNIFIPVENKLLLSQIEAISNKQTGMPAVWETTIPLTFRPTEGLIYYYFLSAEGEPILPPTVNGSNAKLLISLLIYAMVIMIVILIITIFSPDHHYSRYWIYLGKTHPGFFSLAIIPLVIVLILTGDIVINTNNWPGYYSVFSYAAVLSALIFFSKYGRIDYLDFGLRWDKIQHGYLLSLIAAVIMVGITRGIPVGIVDDGFTAVLGFLLIFMLIALPQEMIWRGYIQAVLSRRFDPTKGLFAMILLTAITRFVYLMITAPWMIAYPYTYLELAVLVPGTAAILGYIYLRTENIFSCALMHSLIIWLPGFILF